MRPDVAAAFDRMAAAAREEAGLFLSVTSAFRSDAEQARLFAANPEPEVGRAAGHQPAPLRHRARPRPARRVRLAGRRTHARFGFIHRYAWEPWHYGYGANPRDRQHPARYDQGSWEPPGGDHGRIHHRLPSFVPPRFHDPIAAGGAALERADEPARGAALRGVGLQPVRPEPRRRAGHRPVHAGHRRRVRAARPVRPGRGDRRPGAPHERPAAAFGGKVALALAGYNAGAGAVRALRRRAALRGDARLRREDPRPARRGGRPAGCCGLRGPAWWSDRVERFA